MRTLGAVEALNEALHQAMAEDDSVMILGENIRNGVRAETRGLDERFAPGRVLDMPISEAAFTGFATGGALAGLRPVVEFQVASLMFVLDARVRTSCPSTDCYAGGRDSDQAQSLGSLPDRCARS